MVQQYMHIYMHNNKTNETTGCIFIVFIYIEHHRSVSLLSPGIKLSPSINHTELQFHLSSIMAAMTAQNVIHLCVRPALISSFLTSSISQAAVGKTVHSDDAVIW